MKKLGKKIISHLRGDIKGYNKERKMLKEEAQEDKELIKTVKKSTKAAKNHLKGKKLPKQVKRKKGKK